MFNKKPAALSHSYQDLLFQKAEENGVFDNLPGAGKPIQGLEEPYEEDWWLKNWMKRENLSILPQILEFKLKLESEIEKIIALPDETETRRRIDALNKAIRTLNATMLSGPASDVSMIDTDEIMSQWCLIHGKR